MSVSRRSFLGMSLGGAAAVGALGGARSDARQPVAGQESPASEWSPIADDAAVFEVVGASHRDLDRVREIVTARPDLAKSAVDWGFGDWETALGAASHVGRPDIAELLMAHGARPDLFTFAMLGNLAAVRAMIEAQPDLARLPGPHGITLMRHAVAGGEQAAAVVEYLESLGTADEGAVSQPLENPGAITGDYRITVGGAGRFTIAEGRRGLEFRVEGQPTRNLIHLGGLEFHPVGAVAVRLRFTTGEGGPAKVVVDLGDRALHAEMAA